MVVLVVAVVEKPAGIRVGAKLHRAPEWSAL